MSLARLYSRALRGIDAPQVIVEVHVASGLPSFSIVGLADTEVRESRDRVRSAIQMSGFNFPARRITVNLAPADLPKDSGRYDLPIALGVLIASGLISPKLDIGDYEFAGELALDGVLRKTTGILAVAYNARKCGHKFILPIDNAVEASLVEDIIVYPAETLQQVIEHLCGNNSLEHVQNSSKIIDSKYQAAIDFAEVKGQAAVKFALEVAAAGRHSVLMIGNPGCGKSMLAERLTTILPILTNDESLENASIASLANGGFSLDKWGQIPFRRPHHSSSATAIVGGGSNPKPGEISLAHNGVLFMDEIPEFDRKVLEMLREPLETKTINIARATRKVEFPANFQLIAAMNPCPCGNLGHKKQVCKCSVEQINKYQAKLSAPLLDRIDLMVNMPCLLPEELQGLSDGETSSLIRQRVILARNLQLERQGKLNYELNNQDIEKYCVLDESTKSLVKELINKMGLSARSYFRLLKVARTIADLSGSLSINSKHIAQSAQYKKNF